MPLPATTLGAKDAAQVEVRGVDALQAGQAEGLCACQVGDVQVAPDLQSVRAVICSAAVGGQWWWQ